MTMESTVTVRNPEAEDWGRLALTLVDNQKSAKV